MLFRSRQWPQTAGAGSPRPRPAPPPPTPPPGSATSTRPASLPGRGHHRRLSAGRTSAPCPAPRSRVAQRPASPPRLGRAWGGAGDLRLAVRLPSPLSSPSWSPRCLPEPSDPRSLAEAHFVSRNAQPADLPVADRVPGLRASGLWPGRGRDRRRLLRAHSGRTPPPGGPLLLEVGEREGGGRWRAARTPGGPRRGEGQAADQSPGVLRRQRLQCSARVSTESATAGSEGLARWGSATHE